VLFCLLNLLFFYVLVAVRPFIVGSESPYSVLQRTRWALITAWVLIRGNTVCIFSFACVSSKTHNLQRVFRRILYTSGGHCTRRSLRRP